MVIARRSPVGDPVSIMNRRELLVGSMAAGLVQALSVQKPSVAFTALHGRPPMAERHFHSAVIENVIAEVSSSVSSPELARIFANCFPNTLDTTVFPGTLQGEPDTYVITGDIDAMWLRDSAAQIWPYIPPVRASAVRISGSASSGRCRSSCAHSPAIPMRRSPCACGHSARRPQAQTSCTSLFRRITRRITHALGLPGQMACLAN